MSVKLTKSSGVSAKRRLLSVDKVWLWRGILELILNYGFELKDSDVRSSDVHSL
ncbi:hypothetical protein F2Q70_00044291 [Brassica cretica]|uniref:Uncharacterized protein n=1 Tax=Brassica cretica TaxID=69181 RepID=A0A8S9KIS8_BRACR|nr:hypothetical protein F2Q70_00044291 [Brassica cretica]